MNRPGHFWPLILFAAFAWQTAAAIYTLEPSADARMILYGSLNEQNYQTDFLSVYTEPGNVQRTLLQFDLSGISLAGDERVGSAVLTLTASTSWGPNRGQPMEVQRVAASWSEHTVTWMQRSSGLPWRTPGGDFVSNGGQPYAVSTDSPSNNQPVTWDVTRLADEWLEEMTANYGLLLKSYPGNDLTFAQREVTATNSRPTLTVTTVPGPPRLRAELDRDSGEVILSWRGVGFAVLQERASVNGIWTDSVLPVTAQGERSVVNHMVTDEGRQFRLRLK